MGMTSVASKSLSSSRLRSPLMEAMQLKAHKKATKRSLILNLSLTSLVDAFSILLVYLLFQSSVSPVNIDPNTGDQLPVAVHSTGLENGTVLRIGNDGYYLNGYKVSTSEIAERLKNEKTALIIQADRSIDFNELQPVIRAGAAAGIQQFKFAVQQDEGRL